RDYCLTLIAAGAVSVEQSVNMLLLITALRLYTTFRPFARRVSSKPWLALVLGSWTLSAAVPLLMMSGRDLSRLTENEHKFRTGRIRVGWSCYSTFVVGRESPEFPLFLLMLCYNTLAMIAIVVGYVGLVRRALKPRRSLGNSRGGNDSKLKVRVMVVVLTDVACWIPVIVIAIVNVFSPVSYAVERLTSYLFIPVNSLINPIIYSKADKLIRKYCCRRCCRGEEHALAVDQSASNQVSRISNSTTV
ncbi:MAG: 7 transmembrane receptor, partial [Bacteroidota bacterium]